VTSSNRRLWGPAWPLRPRSALALRRLGAQVDAKWPNRGHASDGWLGDERHAAIASDHNADARGLVHAIDVDVSGVDGHWLVDQVVKHPSTHYVIYDRQIFSRSNGFSARGYLLGDPHTSHVHVSIVPGRRSERSRVRWL
jgi:hypothetical protein